MQRRASRPRSPPCNETKALGPGNTYVALSDWIRRLANIKDRSEDSPLRDSISVLLIAANRFFEQYDNFVKDPSGGETLKLVSDARGLLLVIGFTRGLVTGLLSLNPPGQPKAGGKKLSIFLSVTSDFRGVLSKLDAFEVIYDELCQLLRVSMSEHPLRVVKVESGSLWVKLIGESRVVGLLISLIERTLSFMYRNYTDEGKIVSLPRQAESIEAILKLSGKLEEAGVDTSAIKENLQKSTVIISQRLNDLLVGESRVDINNQTYSIGENLTQKYLEESRTLLLESGQMSQRE